MKLLTLTAIAALAGAAGAHAQDPKPLVRTPIATAAFEAPRTVASVPAVRLDFEPGQPTGRHVHPVPVLGYVLEGEFVVEIKGQPARRYHTGDVVYEPADTQIERYDNASATQRAVLIAFYLAGPGQTELIRMTPAPAR